MTDDLVAHTGERLLHHGGVVVHAVARTGVVERRHVGQTAGPVTTTGGQTEAVADLTIALGALLGGQTSREPRAEGLAVRSGVMLVGRGAMAANHPGTTRGTADPVQDQGVTIADQVAVLAALARGLHGMRADGTGIGTDPPGELHAVPTMLAITTTGLQQCLNQHLSLARTTNTEDADSLDTTITVLSADQKSRYGAATLPVHKGEAEAQARVQSQATGPGATSRSRSDRRPHDPMRLLSRSADCHRRVELT